MKLKLFIPVFLTAVALISPSVFAQTAEINPYAGFYWPNNSFQNNQLLGVRGGYYVTHALK